MADFYSSSTTVIPDPTNPTHYFYRTYAFLNDFNTTAVGLPSCPSEIVAIPEIRIVSID